MWGKNRKKREKKQEKRSKNPFFFAGITSRHPNDPTHRKTGSKSVGLRPGSPVFVGGIPPGAIRDLPPPVGRANLAQRGRYSLY